MNRTIIFIMLLCLGAGLMNAQMGIGTLSPDQRSVLELQCSPGKGRGLLIPRMTTLTRRGMELGAGEADADSVGLALSAQHNGLMLYDNTQNLFYGYVPSLAPVSKPDDYSIAGRDEAKNSVWQILNPWKTQYAWNGSELMVNLVQDIHSTGFVGIGWLDYTESPTYPLHVKGDGYFENSNLTVDKTVQTQKVDADSVGTKGKTKFFGYGITPVGGVMMWSGEWDEFVEAELREEGWLLCDGRDIKGQIPNAKRDGNTPDLRGKFVVGFDPRDDDYKEIGFEGPMYGDSAGVDRDKFYKFADNKKRVKLLEPAMPRHDHDNGNRGAHSHDIEVDFPLLDQHSHYSRNTARSRQESVIGYGTRNGDKVIHITPFYSIASRSTFREEIENGSGYTFYYYTQNNSFKLTGRTITNGQHANDPSGGYTWPSTSSKYRDADESAMAIENRPPFYTVAYIIRVK